MVEREPGQDRFHVSLGLAYALTGRREDAIREGRIGMDMLPISRDALDGSIWMREMAYIYLVAGDRTAAIEQIARQLQTQTYLSPGYYRADLRFAPLRGNPRFEKLTRGGSR